MASHSSLHLFRWESLSLSSWWYLASTFTFLFCFLQDNLANTFTCQVFTFTFVFLNIISLLPTQHSFFSDFLFQKRSPPTFVISDRTLFPQKAAMRINQVYFIFAFHIKWYYHNSLEASIDNITILNSKFSFSQPFFSYFHQIKSPFLIWAFFSLLGWLSHSVWPTPSGESVRLFENGNQSPFPFSDISLIL